MGSPRKTGNTVELVKPFMEELALHHVQGELIWLYDKKIQPCTACRTCQKDWSIFGCPCRDDVGEIFDKLLACNLIVLATPIYSWYCTPPMKALLDRLVYGMNKYYGDARGPALWAGKKTALVVTCGYRPEKGADLFEEGIRRYCKHSQLQYLGMLAERDLGYQSIFMDAEKERHSRSFALEILGSLKKSMSPT
ncbi:MAG: flavodoxin family protein [Synergistaceae bacterium]|nr:flavodoxin family protein [Synergistaceae bacterium]